MDALTRCATLADLLWPDVGADITLRSNPPAVDVTVRAMRDGRLLTSLDDVTAADALAALAAHLEEIARGRVASLRAAGIDAPSPVPSRDELAARLAECERELADVTREHSALVDRYGAAVLRLAERDREPPQRAPGVVAGVAADVVDGWRVALLRATRGVGDVLDVCIAMGDAVAEARQRAGGGEGRGERVEGAQQGAADVGGVAERVVVAEGVAELFAGGACISGDGIRVEVVSMLEHVVREHGGQRVRVVVDVLRGEGGSVHGDSVGPAMGCRESRGPVSP